MNDARLWELLSSGETVELPLPDDPQGPEAKKVKERFYKAAYKHDRKVKVRTDKKAGVARGVLVDEAPATTQADVTDATEEPLPFHETEREETFDKTSLRATRHGLRPHRDYGAHFFRWGWAARRGFINTEVTVLEVGCGVEQPLIGALTGPDKMNYPKRMFQLDINKIDPPIYNRHWLELWDETNFCDVEVQRRLWTANEGPFDLIISFEVIEHMQPEQGREMMEGIYRLTKPDEGRVLLSTPVFNGKAAKNHLHEYTVPELEALVTDVGFTVEKRYGTFASTHDIRRGMTEWCEQRGLSDDTFFDLYEELQGFYSHDVLACFVAPVIPDYSRNNAWILRRKEEA